MSALARRTITLSFLWLATFAFLAFDLHKAVIRQVWPYLTAYYDWLAI
jgi:hypothetical protein